MVGLMTAEPEQPPGGVTQNRWLAETGGDRGRSYDERFTELAASGADVHGEADLCASLVQPGSRVLDAGCGTGRVATELARRSYDVVGVDLDPSMLGVARSQAPRLRWLQADLAMLDAEIGPFDLVLLAGNVMIFLTPGTEEAVLSRLATVLRPGGLLVAGFSLLPDRLDLPAYDAAAAAAGLEPVDRWATWDCRPYAGGDYAVSVHRG
jgi:SAM-dependent methyltransferase